MTFDSLLARSPAQAAFRRRAAVRLAVLAYHGVDDADRFAAHLEFIAKRSHPVTLDDAVAACTGGARLPENPVLVTFDDGDRTVADVALPLLRARGIPAVVYVVASLVGTDAPFWWTEVEWLVEHGGTAAAVAGHSPSDAVRTLKHVAESQRVEVIESLRATASQPAPRRPQLTVDDLRTLETGGVTIGNHTLTHASLVHCDDEQLDREIIGAHERITELLGHAPRSFAYPFGHADDRSEQRIAACGYDVAFVFDHRLSDVPPARPLAVSRLRVNSFTPIERFQTILSGLHPAVLHTLRRA